MVRPKRKRSNTESSSSQELDLPVSVSPTSTKSFRIEKEVKTKFQRYGETVFNYIVQAHENKDYRIRHHQLKALMKTKGLIDKDTPQTLEWEAGRPCRGAGADRRPTGSGKSGMIVLLPYVLQARRVLVLTPSKVISQQLGRAFGLEKEKKCFLEVAGIDKVFADDVRKSLLELPQIMTSAKDIAKQMLGNLVIVNAQKFGGNSGASLVYKNEKIVKDVEGFFDEFDLLIVDEAHHYPAPTWENIRRAFSRKPVVDGLEKKIVFLTATPYRKGEKGRDVFILGSGKAAQGRIAYEVRRDKLEGSEIRKTNFIQKNSPTNLPPATLPRDINQYLAEQQRKEPRFKPQALVIVRTKAEANQVTLQLNNGDPEATFAVAIFGDKSNADELTRQFTMENEGPDYRVAVVCNLLKEGYDNPRVTLCVILRKIGSRILFSQFVGRCMRLNRGLGSGDQDQSEGIVLSYKQFDQQKMWDERDQLATEDPKEVDED